MKKLLSSRGFFPGLVTTGLLLFFAQRYGPKGSWWWALISIAVLYGPSMVIPYIIGCMTGIDNTYDRVTDLIQVEQDRKEEIARLHADVSELKNYIYHRFG